jgi:hypothetical protein
MRREDSDRIEKWAATSLVTAFALLLTLTLCGPAAVAQSAAFHANGAFAQQFSCSQSQTSIECFNVHVVTGPTNGQNTTFIFYEHNIVDLNTGALQDASGFGQIPNSAFQVHGQTDSLNVDTSTVAGFFNQICTVDPNTGGVFTCNSSPGGVVTGTWTVIRNLQTFQNSGTNRATSPNMILLFNGTSDSQAALASVNVLGAALANVAASVGTNHNN